MGFSCLLHFEIVKTNVAYLAQAGGLKSDLASVELKIPQLVVRKNGIFSEAFMVHSKFQKLVAESTCPIQLAAAVAASLVHDPNQSIAMGFL